MFAIMILLHIMLYMMWRFKLNIYLKNYIISLFFLYFLKKYIYLFIYSDLL